MRIAIIGGGAAGCFCAIGLKRRLPDAEVTIYEAGAKLLAKVAVTGGGRCNLTNSFRDVQRLGEVYPRGEQLMRRALAAFSHEDTMRWFEAEGVRLTVQEDQCVFPVSQDAMQIVRTLERCLREAGVRVRLNAPVERVADLDADRIVVTVGGNSREKLERLLPAGVEVTPCVPSLFTLKIPDAGLRALMGTVVEQASLALAGSKFRAAGTLLLTDWGVSGPATLRLSSYAARHLAENGYTGTLLVNWLDAPEAAAREWIRATAAAHPQKQAAGTPPAGLTARLWRHLLGRAGLREDLRWAELGSKGAARLAATLTADAYPLAGRAHFKEEFVTCGGVALSEVNLGTLESKRYPGLFFAGEALDVDAVTGGFNLQAAWSTATVVATSVFREDL
jgi:predicted Rossmann fold flavoprotein